MLVLYDYQKVKIGIGPDLAHAKVSSERVWGKKDYKIHNFFFLLNRKCLSGFPLPGFQGMPLNQSCHSLAMHL